MKQLITTLLFGLFNFSNIYAIKPIKNIEIRQKKAVNSFYTVETFLSSTNKDWAVKTGQKLKWQEKVALNILRKRLRKKAKKNPTILKQTMSIEEKNFNANDLSLLTGIISISSVALLIIIPNGFLIALSLIAAGVAVIAGLIGLTSKQPRKTKSIIGILLGLGIGLLWYWAFTFF